jgi:gamma-glutamylcyclotransferase (GGCT)/AIG2-like uncharacterized protein YtfP
MAQPADHADPAASGVPPETGETLAESGAEAICEGQLVFVYGTLKRGETNHHWLEGACWQGEAELRGVVLHDLGPFPMAVIGDGSAQGEVYAVDDRGLARLDELEGYPRLYDRQRLRLSDGRTAWVYLGRAQQVRHAPELAHGLWPPEDKTTQRR